MKCFHIGSALIVGIVSFTVGCGGEERPAGMPVLQPVTIKIVQDGSPLEGASVQLVPDDVSNRWVSGGSTDANGEVKIVTMGKHQGAPVGKYKITIDKIVNDGPPIAMNEPGGSTASVSYWLVESKYRRADTTTAEITVTEGGTTEETIDVGAAVKDKVPSLN